MAAKREIKKVKNVKNVKNVRFVLLPISEETRGQARIRARLCGSNT